MYVVKRREEVQKLDIYLLEEEAIPSSFYGLKEGYFSIRKENQLLKSNTQVISIFHSKWRILVCVWNFLTLLIRYNSSNDKDKVGCISPLSNLLNPNRMICFITSEVISHNHSLANSTIYYDMTCSREQLRKPKFYFSLKKFIMSRVLINKGQNPSLGHMSKCRN